MAATRKSAKRTAGRKRSRAKPASAKKRPVRKTRSKRVTKSSGTGTRKKKGTNLKRQAKKGLKAARGGIDTVRQAGDKAWEALKSTTVQVVEGVKDRLGGESQPGVTSRE
jgi:hypothetical protein